MTCKEVSELVAGNLFEQAGWGLKLALRLHLLFCRHCRRYARQMRQIGLEARRRWRHPNQQRQPNEPLRRRILDRAFDHADLAEGEADAQE